MFLNARSSFLKLAAVLFIIGLVALWVLFLAGCGYAKHDDPPVYTFENVNERNLACEAHARDVRGIAGAPNTCCGSMLPLIQAGDRLVIAPVQFTDRLLGKVVVYLPAWAHGAEVAHRLVSGDAAHGFIASGDNNARSEPQAPVTAANLVGEVVGIYRVKP